MKLIYDKNKGSTILDGFGILPERQEILLAHTMKVIGEHLKKDADMGEVVCKVIEEAKTTEEVVALLMGFLNFCHRVGVIENYNPTKSAKTE
jgi:hypothetical protein